MHTYVPTRILSVRIIRFYFSLFFSTFHSVSFRAFLLLLILLLFSPVPPACLNLQLEIIKYRWLFSSSLPRRLVRSLSLSLSPWIMRATRCRPCTKPFVEDSCINAQSKVKSVSVPPRPTPLNICYLHGLYYSDVERFDMAMAKLIVANGSR